MSLIKSYPRYLVDKGLLFEINRKVLHPLGLAMIIDISRGKSKQLDIIGIEETDDPDGFMYPDEAFEIGADNYLRFLNAGSQKRLDLRQERFGFAIQETPDVEEIKPEKTDEGSES